MDGGGGPFHSLRPEDEPALRAIAMRGQRQRQPAPEGSSAPPKPDAVVVDIDGTLDLGDGVPNDRVIARVREWFAQGIHVIILTNRLALRQPQTVRWLTYWRVPFHELIMRPLGQRQTDFWSAKDRAYREKIEPQFHVILAVDDHDEPWKALGVPLWQIHSNVTRNYLDRALERFGMMG